MKATTFIKKTQTHFNHTGSLFKKQTFNIKRKLYKNIWDTNSSNSNNNYFQMLFLQFDKIICNDTLKTVKKCCKKVKK